MATKSNIPVSDLRQEAYIKLIHLGDISKLPDNYIRKALINHLRNCVIKEKRNKDIPLSNLKIME
jgi:hypothetical protein